MIEIIFIEKIIWNIKYEVSINIYTLHTINQISLKRLKLVLKKMLKTKY